MTVQELYDHIINHLTPEEALKRLLESHQFNYEHLKMGLEPGKQTHPLIIISMAALDLGWDMAIEKEEENVRGIMLGTDEYFLKNLSINNTYKEICEILVSIFYYGSFVAETYNEREIEKLLTKAGLWPTTEEEIIRRDIERNQPKTK